MDDIDALVLMKTVVQYVCSGVETVTCKNCALLI